MTKLTLSVDEDVVKQAKAFAKDHNTSVSAVFTNYVRALEGAHKKYVEQIGPITAKASGLISLPDDKTGSDINPDALAVIGIRIDIASG